MESESLTHPNSAVRNMKNAKNVLIRECSSLTKCLGEQIQFVEDDWVVRRMDGCNKSKTQREQNCSVPADHSPLRY